MNINQLVCALSNDHIIRDAVPLNCNHYVCNKCISYNDENKKVISCKLCGKITNKVDLMTNNESSPINKKIKLYLFELFEDIEKRTTEGINKLKSNATKKVI